MPLEQSTMMACGVAKYYGATCALRSANLSLRPGRIHALLGENGAGKSSLVKVIVGAMQPSEGFLTLNGKRIVFRSVSDAMTAGIIPVYQHLSLFPDLSVIENLSAFAFGSKPASLVSSALIQQEQAERWLSEVGLAVDLEAPVSSLSLGEKQLLEIARGLGQTCKVLVLDEPTAALNNDETSRLFAVLRRLCAAGTAVLFISHKLDEIETIADDVTVLRDGRSVIESAPVSAHSRAEWIEAMLGTVLFTQRTENRPIGLPRLVTAGLRSPDGLPCAIAIHAGEIVGLAGLAGSGALEIASRIAGASPGEGSVSVGTYTFNAGDRIRAAELGLGYLPSDRHVEGLFMPSSVTSNASVGILPRLTRFGMLARRAESESVQPILQRLGLHPFQPNAAVATFSGGNQQKVLLARCLAMSNLAALVLLEPTRGVDIGARETIHSEILAVAARGVAILLATSDLDELAALSHRILIVRQGAIVAELPAITDSSKLTAALAA